MEDLEAPGQDRDLRLCDRCFFILPPTAEFCPDCGAPIDRGEAHLAGSDAAVYPELAQANLLRMRGQYKQAEEVCIGILRKYPNQGTATSLLGDICMERGDIDQAIQWFELALDIMPDSEIEQQKLVQAKARKHDHDVAATAAQLGLPSRKPLIGLFAGGVLAVIALTGIAAYLLGRQNAPAFRNYPVVEAPVTIGEAEKGGSNPAPKTNEPRTSPVQDPTPKTEPVLPQTLEEKLLADLNPDLKLIKVWQDPRTARVYIDMVWRGVENERLDAALLARKTFRLDEKCPKITVRALESNADKYLADSMREAFPPTESEEWITANGDSATALADALLSNEWRPGAAPLGAPTDHDKQAP